MSRTQSQGIEYFPFAVDFFADNKVKILKARYGADGIMIYMYILCCIYREGYYTRVNDDFIFVISDDLHISSDTVQQVMTFLLKRSMFNEQLFKSDAILTSDGIQERWQRAIAKRAQMTPIKVSDYWLLDEADTKPYIKVAHFPDSLAKKDNSLAKKDNSLANYPQSKVKESKEEKIYKKESEFSEEEVKSIKATQTEIPFLIAEESSLSDRVITESEIEEYFKKIYEIYPRKVSKIRAKETFEHKLRGYSSDEGHKIAQKIYKTVKHQAEVWSEENDGTGRRWEMIPHFSTWLNDNVENSPKFRRGKG